MRAPACLLLLGTFGLLACSGSSPPDPSGGQNKADSGKGSDDDSASPAPVAHDSGKPDKDPEASADLDSGDPAADAGSDEDVGTGTPPGGGGKAPPPGWLALVGGDGTFGQTYDNTTWSTKKVTTGDLFAVSCVTNLSGWVAGAHGYVAHTPDGGWTFDAESTPFTADLRSLHFADESLGVVAGDGGALAVTHDGGAHWLAAASGSTANLRGTAMSPAIHAIYAVGDAGTLVVSRDDGKTFTATALAGAGNLRGVTADASGKVVLAVDDLGHVFSSGDGAVSFSLAVTAPRALEAVALKADGEAAIAVGAGGTALGQRGAGGWVSLATGTTEDLHAAMIPWRDGQIYVAGDHGTLRTSLDHGAHFDGVTLATSNPIFSLEDL